MGVSVTTRSYSNLRDGANLAETVLTAIPVQKQGIAHLFDCMLPGDERGSEGQPLIVSGLTMGDGEVHNVLYVASMSNDVRAFDADTPSPETGQGQILWERRVGNPIKGTVAMDMYKINDFWGILSTPVIDLTTGTLYVVSMSSPDGLIADSYFTLHALSLLDGSDQAPPLNLNAATVTQLGADGATHVSNMGLVPRKQRCGLALVTVAGVKLVIVANGSFNEDADTNQGWVIACEVSAIGTSAGAMSISASWISSTPPQSGGGIWMGAQAPSVDAEGFIYGMIGNGDFQPPYSFGESFYKLQYTPATASSGASLKVVQWFTPYTDSGRVGADPTLPSAPSDSDAPGGTSNMDDPGDEDLNSGGPLLLPATLTGFTLDLILGAGKDGILYVVNPNAMGNPINGQFAQAEMQQVYDMLLMSPIFFTYDGYGIDPAPLNTADIPTTAYGFTHHQHSTPVFYKSPRFGNMLFTGGENSPVRAFTITEPAPGKIAVTYLACGDVIASQEVGPPGGMPGTMMTLSANGSVEDTAVLWCLNPYGDANKTITPGRIVAYGADWIDNGTLLKIWDSSQWGIELMHNKFNIPTVANSKLYVPSYDGRVQVFGLAPA